MVGIAAGVAVAAAGASAAAQSSGQSKAGKLATKGSALAQEIRTQAALDANKILAPYSKYGETATDKLAAGAGIGKKAVTAADYPKQNRSNTTDPIWREELIKANPKGLDWNSSPKLKAALRTAREQWAARTNEKNAQEQAANKAFGETSKPFDQQQFQTDQTAAAVPDAGQALTLPAINPGQMAPTYGLQLDNMRNQERAALSAPVAPVAPEAPVAPKPVANQQVVGPQDPSAPANTASASTAVPDQQAVDYAKAMQEYTTKKAAYDKAMPEYTTQKAAYDKSVEGIGKKSWSDYGLQAPVDAVGPAREAYKKSDMVLDMPRNLEELQQTPGYQFQLQQGLQSSNNSAAQRGSLLSGAQLKGLNNYAQNVAATGWQNAFNNAQSSYAADYGRYNQAQDNVQTDHNRNFSNQQSGYQQAYDNQQGTYQQAFQNQNSQYTDAFNRAQQAYQNAFSRNLATKQNQYNQTQGVQQGAQNAAGQQAQNIASAGADNSVTTKQLYDTRGELAQARAATLSNLATSVGNAGTTTSSGVR